MTTAVPRKLAAVYKLLGQVGKVGFFTSEDVLFRGGPTSPFAHIYLHVTLTGHKEKHGIVIPLEEYQRHDTASLTARIEDMWNRYAKKRGFPSVSASRNPSPESAVEQRGQTTPF